MDEKQCNSCKVVKELTCFIKRKTKSGYGGTCKECKNRKQRESRVAIGNSYTRKYEKSLKGFIMRTYRNMKSRVEGVQKGKAHLYFGKFLVNKEDFYLWVESRDDFFILWGQWLESDYDRKLTPSIDRVDSNLGYDLSNMRWITHSENSRLGAESKYSK